MQNGIYSAACNAARRDRPAATALTRRATSPDVGSSLVAFIQHQVFYEKNVISLCQQNGARDFIVLYFDMIMRLLTTALSVTSHLVSVLSFFVQHLISMDSFFVAFILKTFSNAI